MSAALGTAGKGRWRRRLFAVSLLWLPLAAAAAVAQDSRGRAGSAGAPAAIDDRAAADSHRRMIDALRQIADRTDVDNPWLGEGRRTAARERLGPAEAGGDRVALFRALLDLAEQDLRMGDETVAMTTSPPPTSSSPSSAAASTSVRHPRAVFRLAVAHLRYGESQNCSARHNANSCILPIRGAGVHADPEGSRQAIRYFEEVMSRVPQSSPLFVKTVWLANIAHMTLGDYPHGGARELPHPDPRCSRPTQPFPHFENVAPEPSGVGTWSLSGGAVFDDFDGDGDLDLLTTTFDTRGDPRLLQERRRGAASTAPSRAGLTGLFGGLNLVQSDYDNDGDLDVYVLRGAWLYAAGRHPGSLLAQRRHGRFTDVTFAAGGLGAHRGPTQTGGLGRRTTTTATSISTSATSTAPTPTTRPTPAPSSTRRASSTATTATGTFTEVAAAAGVRAARVRQGRRVRRLRQRRRPRPLRLGPRRGRTICSATTATARFTDVTAEAGVGAPIASFPVWFWDFDNDGNLDLYVSTYAGAEDTVALVAASYFGLDSAVRAAAPLPRRRPRPVRGRGRGDRGCAASTPAMGSNFGDLDNDGWLDFYLGTGYPNYEGLMPNVLYRDRRGQELRRRHDGGRSRPPAEGTRGGDRRLRRRRRSGPVRADGRRLSRATASPTRCSRTPATATTGSASSWSGTRSNRAGDRRAHPRRHRSRAAPARSIYRTVGSGGSFGCNPLRQTIGLGQAERVERLEVWWPASGERQAWTGLAADTVVRIVEPRRAVEARRCGLEPTSRSRHWRARSAAVPRPRRGWSTPAHPRRPFPPSSSAPSRASARPGSLRSPATGGRSRWSRSESSGSARVSPASIGSMNR